MVNRMYADYLRLRSLRAVGRIYGRSNQALHEMFQRRGLKMYRVRLEYIDYKGHRYTPRGKGGYYGRTTGNKRLHLNRVIWEEAHGPVPEGYEVWFVDGDRTNFDLENLELRKRSGARANPLGVNGHTVKRAEEMCARHIGFITLKAQRLAGQFGVPIEDLIQCGRIGVFEAVKRFDKKIAKEKGAKFLTFAAFHIRAQMQRYLRANTRTVRRPANRLLEGEDVSISKPIAGCEDLTLGDLLGADEQVTGATAAHELRARVAEALQTLDAEEREIVELYFFENLTHDAIGKKMGVTGSAIQQRLPRALRTLRYRLKDFQEAA